MRTLVSLVLLLALQAVTLGPVAEAQAPTDAAPAPVASPPTAIDPVCEQSFAALATTASASAPGADTADDERLDDTIRACGSILEWTSAAWLHADKLGDVEPLRHLQARCADETASLDVYATCRSLDIALAPPGPADAETIPAPDVPLEPITAATPVPAASATPMPAATSQPTGSPGTTTTGEGSAPRVGADGQVRLPRNLRARVPGATRIRYFDIAGRSAPVLVRQTLRRSAPHCGVHDALACVRLTWRVQTVQAGTTTCTVAKAYSTVTSEVFLPRWSNPRRVDPELLRWWRKVLLDSARHEARHISILQTELTRLRRQLVGRPCSSIGRLVDRARKRSDKAQAAFDRRESAKPLPPAP